MSTELQCGGDAAGYVLGAMTPEEKVAFRRHMMACPECREEVDMLEAASAALPLMSAPKPERMTERAQMIAERRADAAARRPLARRPDAKGRRGAGVKDRLTKQAPKPVMAAFGVLAVLGVLTVTLGSPATPTRIVRAQVAFSPGAAAVKIDGSNGELLVIGLPAAPSGDVYQIWVTRTGHTTVQPTRARFAPNGLGEAGVNVPGGIAGVRQVEVTAEPTGGSRTPSGAPVILATLPG
jgi:anti-sigma-K factor RskA